MDNSTLTILRPVALKTNLGYVFYEYNEIIRIEADRKVALVYIVNCNKPQKALCNFLTIESLLSVAAFYRCHRSHIVNLRYIKEFLVKSRQLVMINGNEIPISEDKIREFKERFIPNTKSSRQTIV